MPDTPTVRAVIETYLERHAVCDLKGVLSLFARDAVVEDPVGSRPHRGHAAIREFFRATHQRNGSLRVEAVGPVLVCGREAGAHVRAAASSTNFEVEVDVLYTFAVDAEGKITSLRAFFEID